MTLEEPAGGVPAMRASDADRERVAGVLQQAVADGRLTIEEFDERCASAYAARTHDELAVLTRDLLHSRASSAVPARQSRPAAETAPPVVAVFSGARRVGRWRPARRERVVAVFGGAELDLREAELPAGGLHISAWAVFGGVDVTVPDGVRVEDSGFAVFGGRDVQAGLEDADVDAYVVHVHAVTVFGGVTARRTGPRRRGG